MNNIKFRAWHRKKKRMGRVVTFLHLDWSTPEIVAVFTSGRKSHTSGKYVDDKWGERDYDLMQYTGLKDKNGKEIYFDDILKMPHGIGKVEFRADWARICVDDYSLTAPLLQVSEVIGNIYENPDLLDTNDTDLGRE